MEAKLVKDYLTLLNQVELNVCGSVNETDERILHHLHETRDALAKSLDVLTDTLIRIDLKILELGGVTEHHIDENELMELLDLPEKE